MHAFLTSSCLSKSLKSQNSFLSVRWQGSIEQSWHQGDEAEASEETGERHQHQQHQKHVATIQTSTCYAHLNHNSQLPSRLHLQKAGHPQYPQWIWEEFFWEWKWVKLLGEVLTICANQLVDVITGILPSQRAFTPASRQPPSSQH